jgi:hypothetical protein
MTNEEIKQTEETINEQEMTMDQLIAQQESLSEKLYKKEIVDVKSRNAENMQYIF